jgi:protein-arginine kinase activator protein McsA
MDWHELEKLKVVELRELAKEKASATGTTGMSKDRLVEVVAEAMGIEKPHLVVEGLDKTKVKRKIRALREEVRAAIEAKDRRTTREKRRQIHRLKRRMHRAARLTH